MFLVEDYPLLFFGWSGKMERKEMIRVLRGVPLVVEDWLLFVLQSEFLVGRSMTT